MFREIEDIVETLKNAKSRGKKCSVLIGAGCSVTAGIPTAQGLVDIIKERYPRGYERADSKTYPNCMNELSIDEQRSLIAEHVDKAKINWAHIALAQLMKAGYVDRVLTTNFDPLIMRACALVGLYPATYDLVASQNFKPDKVPDQAVFHLHGQRAGFVLLNSEKSLREQSEKIAPVFEDAGRGRVWLVAGYSGENDPVFDHLAKVDCFDNMLYWAGYKDGDPATHLRERLLTEGKYAFYVKGFDADSFFVTLAQKLDCFPPDFVGKPFSYLSELFNQMTEYTLPKTDSPVDALKNARSYVQEAIERIEGAKSDVLEASSNLLSGEYDKVVKLRPKGTEVVDPKLSVSLTLAYIAQGNDLLDQAKTKIGAEADEMFKQAVEKYEAALKIKPDFYSALNNWGNTLLELAKTKSGAEADELFKQAVEKYEAALQIKPDFHEALYNWGSALSDWAKTKNDAEADDLFKQAGEKYEAALQIKPNNHEALNNWGAVLLDMAKMKSGVEANELFKKAKDVFLKAESIKKGHSSYNLACVCAISGFEKECHQWLIQSKQFGELPVKQYLEQDTDLDSIRDKKWFLEFMKELE